MEPAILLPRPSLRFPFSQSEWGGAFWDYLREWKLSWREDPGEQESWARGR